MPSIVTLTCQQCGNEFRSSKQNAKHCSLACRHAGHRSVEVACLVCGKLLKEYPSKRRKYCSAGCYGKSQRISQTCEFCGKEFRTASGKRQRFCSNGCRIDGCRGYRKHTPESFWATLEKPDGEHGCWIWVERPDKGGYGTISFYDATWKTHRLAYHLTHGAIPPSLFVCHKCANPPCCNPDHLYAGTPQQNSRDMVMHGNSLKGEKNHKAKVTADQVREIRSRYSAGDGTTLTLAEEYGVTQAVISKMIRRETWKHVK